MSADDDKKLAAQSAVDLVEDGMVLGLGTGSTAVFAVQLLGERVKKGLKIKGVPTSDSTEKLARSVGIPIVTLDEFPALDLDIDGADEVEPSLCLIKGGGGALLREKIVAYASKRVVIIVDEKKLVEKLGKFHLPIEIVPFSRGLVQEKVDEMGAKSVVRVRDDRVFRTDENNLILDCDFGLIEDPRALAQKLSLIPGIVEHGLFIDMVERVIIGNDGKVKELTK
ncbi:MAG TPA: ribose-5-phosphate isomerase RpiA [Candidatus Melainabacteria bacterium]|jgi:ribose 5-phosphate isomerase A|nr:ribose-5-phosphate isomerase RpiA [Candidatus Melainabacteria bacterium]HIN67358.1 ribose-5-phosphate isomerase RpiA [Candidatus Obscuribacterales bacterium]